MRYDIISHYCQQICGIKKSNNRMITNVPKGMVSNISLNQENKQSDFDAVGRIHSQLL